MLIGLYEVGEGGCLRGDTDLGRWLDEISHISIASPQLTIRELSEDNIKEFTGEQ